MEQQRANPELPPRHVEGSAPAVSSRDLMRGTRQLIIEHGEDRYRLMLTKNNKLILIK